MTPYYDLGTYRRTTSTASDKARRWFDRGLMWAYAFNHEEAVECFERALEHDPSFALARWGIAYSLGPNYNKAWEQFDEQDLTSSVSRAFIEVSLARDDAAAARPVERALIHALAARYPSSEPPLDGSVWSGRYADAMREVYREHRDDLDVAALFADALMNLTPWALWDQATGRPAQGAPTLEAKEVLERALQDPEGGSHPGVLHFYVHLMEMSPHPERALPMAEALRGLVPDASHLLHMPSHIDVLCGAYQRAVTANSRAIAADERFVERSGEMNFYAFYRAHNYHFKIYGAMLAGQAAAALDAADGLARALPERLLRVRSPVMADWLEGFVPMRMHVLIRFGMWEEILAATAPDDQDLYCVTAAMIHYAKGVALAASGRVEEAEDQRRRFAAALARVPETRIVFNNTCRDILAVAAAMLDGELAYRKADYDEAFAHLRRAIELDDGLPYDEPWGWMQPTRHAYGALLLEQGHVEQAERIYRDDLGLGAVNRARQHPNNVWSLHGYHECLVRLEKPEPARIIQQQLDIATAQADVPIRASCYCRLTHAA